MCLCVLVDMREGQPLNPLPACSHTVSGSWNIGAWGAPGCTLGSQTGGAGERGTSSCITGEERGSQAALAGCASGAAAEAEGFLDQPTRLGRGGGVGWGFASLGILNCEA